MIKDNGLKTCIKELKNLIIEYKMQLKRMKIDDCDNYPLILNIKNNTDNIDDWEFQYE